jgi:hypothetical protein
MFPIRGFFVNQWYRSWMAGVDDVGCWMLDSWMLPRFVVTMMLDPGSSILVWMMLDVGLVDVTAFCGGDDAWILDPRYWCG